MNCIVNTLWNSKFKQIKIWSAVMNEYVKLKQYNKVLLIMDGMKEHNIVYNNIIYSNGITACIHLYYYQKE